LNRLQISQLDLPGLYVHDLAYQDNGSSDGSVEFSAQSNSATNNTTSAGDTWTVEYTLGATGPFPDVDTSRPIVNFATGGHQWTIYHDKKGVVTVLMIHYHGQIGLLATPGKGRSVPNADIEAFASKITLAPAPTNPNTWFDA
jgi:hypothetical protein